MGRVVFLAGLWATATCVVLRLGSLPAVGSAGTATPSTGGQSRDVKGRIVRGYYAYPGEFPYMAALHHGTVAARPWCSGVLVGTQWVLTTAQCLTDAPNQYQVIIGYTDVSTRPGASEESFVYYNISKFPNFKKAQEGTKPEHNIALIHLPHGVIQTENIKLARLPKGVDSFKRVQYGNVSGWGFTKNRILPQGDQLKWGEMKISDDSLRNPPGPEFTIDGFKQEQPNSTVPCRYDEGSPFVVNNTVLGIASYTPNDCLGGEKTIFTNVGFYKDWLLCEMRQQGYKLYQNSIQHIEL